MNACMHACVQRRQQQSTYVPAEHVLLGLLHVVVQAGLDVVLWIVCLFGGVMGASQGCVLCGDRRDSRGSTSVLRAYPTNQPNT